MNKFKKGDLKEKLIIVGFVVFIAVGIYWEFRNIQQVCKTQSTYMVRGTTYACEGK